MYFLLWTLSLFLTVKLSLFQDKGLMIVINYEQIIEPTTKNFSLNVAKTDMLSAAIFDYCNNSY